MSAIASNDDDLMASSANDDDTNAAAVESPSNANDDEKVSTTATTTTTVTAVQQHRDVQSQPSSSDQPRGNVRQPLSVETEEVHRHHHHNTQAQPQNGYSPSEYFTRHSGASMTPRHYCLLPTPLSSTANNNNSSDGRPNDTLARGAPTPLPFHRGASSVFPTPCSTGTLLTAGGGWYTPRSLHGGAAISSGGHVYHPMGTPRNHVGGMYGGGGGTGQTRFRYPSPPSYGQLNGGYGPPPPLPPHGPPPPSSHGYDGGGGGYDPSLMNGGFNNIGGYGGAPINVGFNAPFRQSPINVNASYSPYFNDAGLHREGGGGMEQLKDPKGGEEGQKESDGDRPRDGDDSKNDGEVANEIAADNEAGNKCSDDSNDNGGLRTEETPAKQQFNSDGTMIESVEKIFAAGTLRCIAFISFAMFSLILSLYTHTHTTQQLDLHYIRIAERIAKRDTPPNVPPNGDGVVAPPTEEGIITRPSPPPPSFHRYSTSPSQQQQQHIHPHHPSHQLPPYYDSRYAHHHQQHPPYDEYYDRNYGYYQHHPQYEPMSYSTTIQDGHHPMNHNTSMMYPPPSYNPNKRHHDYMASPDNEVSSLYHPSILNDPNNHHHPPSTTNMKTPKSKRARTSSPSNKHHQQQQQRALTHSEEQAEVTRAINLAHQVQNDKDLFRAILLHMALEKENPKKKYDAMEIPEEPVSNEIQHGFYWKDYPVLEDVLRGYMEDYYVLR